MPTTKKRKSASTQTSGNDIRNAIDAPEVAFQRNALKKLSSEELDSDIRDRARDLHILTRKAQALEKKRLLPEIEEVKRRIKNGKAVAGPNGVLRSSLWV